MKWEESAHGNTYDLGKGPNTYCSRCHSPSNWDPESTTGPPPNCVNCKFPTDEEVRDAPTMAFVEEEDWANITCENCHELAEEIIFLRKKVSDLTDAIQTHKNQFPDESLDGERELRKILGE